MYKLLIVDDECMITDLLYEYLSQKSEGELDIYKAYSGRSAAAMLSDNPADILLTDINMPGMNGLDLHRAAIIANTRCKVIFLTGYNDFNNIQYALRNESVDFILKTESNEMIYQSIEKAVKALDDERNAELLRLRATEQLRQTLPVLQERLILSLLSGEAYNEQDFSEAELPVNPAEPVLLLMGHVDDAHVPSGMEFYRLKHMADEYIAQDHRVFSVIEGKDLLWLIQARLYDQATTFARLRSIMDAIQQLCAKAFHISVSMALAEDFTPFSDIALNWHGLKKSLNDLYGLSHGILLTVNPGRLAQNGASLEFLYIRRILSHLEVCVSGLQADEFQQYYNELKMHVRDNPKLSRNEINEIFMRLYLVFLTHFNNDSDNDAAMVFDIETGGDWSIMEERIAMAAEAYFARRDRKSFRNTNEMLGRLADYIHNNLGGDVSLNKLAEIAHFSPSYLSRLFKQVTGVSLTEYVGRLKIDKAAKLLVGSDMKVAEIARLLGFETQSYFTRFFKKRLMIGPQEYREANRSKKDKEDMKG